MPKPPKPSRRAPRRAVALAEPLEARRLLAATLDAASGVLTVTGTDAKDIVQFQVANTASAGDRATTFTVLESTTTAASPGQVPSRAAVLDFIASGGTPVSSQFDLASVNTVVINTDNNDDLIIIGGALPLPVQINGGNGDDSVSGGDGADSLSGGNGDDYVFGRNGDDVVSGELGADDIYGGDGFDYTEYRTRTNDINVGIGNLPDDGEAGEGDNVRNDIEGVIGGLGNDQIQADNNLIDPNVSVVFLGNAGDDTLIGTQGNDTLVGGTGNDSLDGAGGDDFIDAQDKERDIILGGPGFDTALTDDNQDSGPGAGVVEIDNITSIEQGLTDVPRADPAEVAGGTASLDDGVLTVSGTDGADIITVQRSTDESGIYVREARAGDNDQLDIVAVTRFTTADVSEIRFNGGSGSDLLAALGTQQDIPVFINGGSGDDTVIGSLTDDTLDGGSGDDYVTARDGDDVLVGDLGSDYMTGGAGDDTADYSDRTGDLLIGLGLLPDDGERGEADNLLTDIETVLGGSGNDNLSTTGDVAVRFVGNAGRDTLTGGNGSDFFEADDGEEDDILGLGGDDDGDFDDEDNVDLGDGQ